MRAPEFFAFARERHSIHLRRQAGLSRPEWTRDPILQKFRFTNVFRELDRTTVWFREHVRDDLARHTEEQQMLGTILFRTFNRIESMERVFTSSASVTHRCQGWGWEWLRGEMDTAELGRRMRHHIEPPWVTGAYIVKTPDGMDKLDGALWIVEEARRRARATVLELRGLERSPASLQSLHSRLVEYPYLGGFTAYEIVSDLRWLPIMQSAPDVMTWAHAGPGAIRGINRLMGWDRDRPTRQDTALTIMRALLMESRAIVLWPPDWPDWEMRDVEHTLCEWDKYERVRLGEGRPRGVYG